MAGKIKPGREPQPGQPISLRILGEYLNLSPASISLVLNDAPGARAIPQETPYPGSNLFSLASGGAIFVRDPLGVLVEEQLNGGQFLPFGDAEWELIRPYLEENEHLFGIAVDQLLTVNGRRRSPGEVYRMIGAVKLSVLAAGAAAALDEWEGE